MERIGDAKDRGVAVATGSQGDPGAHTHIAKSLILFGEPGEPRRILFFEDKGGSFAGMLNLPGGHLEPGETSFEAIVRELQEEVGLFFEKPEEALTYLAAITLTKWGIVGHLYAHDTYTHPPKTLSNNEPDEHDMWLFTPQAALSPPYRERLVPGIAEALELLFRDGDRLPSWAGKVILHHTIGEPGEPQN